MGVQAGYREYIPEGVDRDDIFVVLDVPIDRDMAGAQSDYIGFRIKAIRCEKVRRWLPFLPPRWVARVFLQPDRVNPKVRA